MTIKDPPIEGESSKFISICLMAKGRLQSKSWHFTLLWKNMKNEWKKKHIRKRKEGKRKRRKEGKAWERKEGWKREKQWQVKGSRICHLKIYLFGIRIILSWVFFKDSWLEKHSEKQVQVTLLYQTITFIREISFCRGMTFSVPGREGQLNLYETLPVEKSWTSVYTALIPLCFAW